MPSFIHIHESSTLSLLTLFTAFMNTPPSQNSQATDFFRALRLSPTELEMRSEALMPSFGYIRAVSRRVLTLTSQPIAFYSRDKQAHPSQSVALEPVEFALLLRTSHGPIQGRSGTEPSTSIITTLAVTTSTNLSPAFDHQQRCRMIALICAAPSA